VAHSLSPVLHRAAYAALGLDWDYTAIDCGIAGLSEVLAERPDWAGFSCTMPLKRALLDVAAEVGPVARAIGAANTLLPTPDSGWAAENTDVTGIADALTEGAVPLGSMTILGAGGTAQAALAAAAGRGVRRCVVLTRDPARTVALRASAAVLGVAVEVEALTATSPALDADLVVSTLPQDAADQVAGFGWRAEQTVLDVVYDPWPTVLAAAAASAGARVLGGALVLLHQAAAQVELMTGLPAPVAQMRSALRAAAPGCGA
jgi:shikimate dehydrogenase